MPPRIFGSTNVSVQPIALGAMNFGRCTDRKEASRMIDMFLDHGYGIINTADVDYSGVCEEMVGRHLRGSGKRASAFLSVEISGKDMGVPDSPNLSPEYVIPAVDRALQRLGVDRIDLINIPRPNMKIPLVETLGAMGQLVDDGKVRFVGTSTFPSWLVREAIASAEFGNFPRVVSELSPYNLLDRRVENELVPMCQQHGLALLAWAPIAQGVLANRYSRTDKFPIGTRAAELGGIYAERVNDAGVAIGKRLEQLGNEIGKVPAQLALMWVRDRPGVTAAVVGPRNVDQLETLLGCCEDTLSEHEREAMDRMNPPGSVVTDFFNTAPWMLMSVGGSDVDSHDGSVRQYARLATKTRKKI